MKLSVIIPVYNAEKTIEEAVKSILKCSEQEMEVILIDDGSTDGSKTVLDKLAKEDKRCRVIHKQNGGVSSARNAGIDAACGEYIYFCDSDDFVFAEVLEKGLKCIDKGADLFIFDFLYNFISDGRVVKGRSKLKGGEILDREYIMSEILFPLITQESTDMASLWHKFFKKSVIKKHNIRFEEDVHRGEDWRFIVDFLAVTETAFYVPEILYEYRLDGSQNESKYKKALGIQPLGTYKRKLDLNEKFHLNADKNTVWRLYAGVVGEIVCLAGSDFSVKELYKATFNELVKKSARILLYTKKQTYIQNEISRKYRIYAFLIRFHLPHLLKIAVNRLAK